MSMHDDIALTLRLVQQRSNWRPFAALAGLVAMIGGMITLMWFLSQPVMDLRGWLAGALSVAGMLIWRTMLTASK